MFTDRFRFSNATRQGVRLILTSAFLWADLDFLCSFQLDYNASHLTEHSLRLWHCFLKEMSIRMKGEIVFTRQSQKVSDSE